MRRMLVLGSAVGLLVFSSACATTTGGNGSSSFSTTPSVKRLSRQEQVVWRDSVYAQAIADVEGPGATIRAEFSNMAGSRRVRARFNLDDDAYVVIGHIDGAGVLRIAFPVNPAIDDGFVKGNKTYQTHEFFAGFTDEYRFRTAGYRPVTRNPDSYDGGLGFMFIIASWRPMHFDRFREGDSWDSFELTDDSYLRDPRPAIYELATLLVGESREAYTVKFARYMSTTSYAMSPFGGNAYNSFSYCNGYRPLGFAYDPLADGFLMGMMSSMGYGSYGGNFSRRGVNYYYDSFGDCYRTGSPFGYLNRGYRIATGPTNPGGGGGTVKRPFDPEDLRVPFNPRPTQPSSLPGGRVVEDNARGELPVSPTYRQRGLITTDDQGLPGRREPRVAAGQSEARSRPSIQDMVGRRPAANEGSSRAGTGYARSNGSTYGSSSSGSRPMTRDRSGGSSSTGVDAGAGGRFSGSSSSGSSGSASSVGATAGGTGGSTAAASSSSGSSTGTAATGSSSGGRPPL